MLKKKKLESQSFSQMANLSLLAINIGKLSTDKLLSFFRFTDFIVNEIGLDGQVVVPPPRLDRTTQESAEETKQADAAAPIELTPEQSETFRKMLSDDDHRSLLRFIEEANLYVFESYEKIYLNSCIVRTMESLCR